MLKNTAAKASNDKNDMKRNKNCTISIAIPASIIDNAQSFELKTYLVCQIARAAAIYKVDEIVIISSRGKYSSSLAKSNPTEFFVRNLEYLESPPYLRKALFPVCPELKYSGLMNPLDVPHHVKSEQWSQYREGVVVTRPIKPGKGSWVNIGLKKDCQVDLHIEEGTRVTVKLKETDFTNAKNYNGAVISPEEASKELGVYWGYTVRVADNLQALFNESPYDKGYDLKLGISSNGDEISNQTFENREHSHVLLVFGGLEGLEGLIEMDESLKINPEDYKSIFDQCVNTCPNQGTSTLRTEESILISLCSVSSFL